MRVESGEEKRLLFAYCAHTVYPQGSPVRPAGSPLIFPVKEIETQGGQPFRPKAV